MWPFKKPKAIELPKRLELPKTLAEQFLNRELEDFWENYDTIKLIDYEELDGDDIKLVGIEYMTDGSATPPVVWVRVSGDWFWKHNPRFPAFMKLGPIETNPKMWKQVEHLQDQYNIKKKYGDKFDTQIGYGNACYRP